MKTQLQKLKDGIHYWEAKGRPPMDLAGGRGRMIVNEMKSLIRQVEALSTENQLLRKAVNQQGGILEPEEKLALSSRFQLISPENRAIKPARRITDFMGPLANGHNYYPHYGQMANDVVSLWRTATMGGAEFSDSGKVEEYVFLKIGEYSAKEAFEIIKERDQAYAKTIKQETEDE